MLLYQKLKLKKATNAFIDKTIETFEYIEDPILRINQIKYQSYKIIDEFLDEKYFKVLSEGDFSEKRLLKRKNSINVYVKRVADQRINKYRVQAADN